MADFSRSFVLCLGVLKNENDVEEIEENFEEAVKNVNNVLVNTRVRVNDH